MPNPNADISIRIAVLDPQGEFLGGVVELLFKPQAAGEPVTIKGDASKEIDVSGLTRAVSYDVTVSGAGIAKAVSEKVEVPAKGTASVRVVITNAPASKSLQGSLVLDNGMPAAGVTVRLYSIGFAGQNTTLREVKADAQGKYTLAYATPNAASANIQMRAVGADGKEVTISATKFKAGASETLNLVVPSRIQPLAPEFERLSADLKNAIGDKANLAQAQEGPARQDLTLLSQSTNWDARLIALAAAAAQQSGPSGLGQDVLYALYRVGLPTDPDLLAMVPASTAQDALTKATQAGIVGLTDEQMKASAAAFQKFATRTLLVSKAPGALSTFDDLLSTHFKDPAQLTAFATLYFNQAPGADLWTQALAARIPAATVDALKLQGKFLYLTFNNGVLAQKLQQDIGTVQNISRLTDLDYHQPAAWHNTLAALAGAGSVDALIPPAYAGATTADRLAAYSGDMARRVMISFPTHAVARMVETKDLAVDPAAAATLPAFLRAAANLGYSLGRTPLNGFLANSAKDLPKLDDAAKQSLKTLHRLYQVTPSTESLQAALKLGFKSAADIASHSKVDFEDRFGYAFPPAEVQIIYRQAQTISSVTFNFFSMAKGLDTMAPVYALSSSSSDRQDAKNSLVEQFPSMATLFGNLDFCQCDDCRSVLSPAAYFVDLLDLLGQESKPNAAGNTPLDILIGNSGGVKGRRPDLGALPLTCANTNTAMPYIDLVNEILEYYIAHGQMLDAGVAYDTGSATTADLTAEPQHIIPSVYSTTLNQALYPLNLPFDLWIESVRGFLRYFKTSLAQVLDTLRPADALELFTSAPTTPYDRAGILSESLGISPAEYAVFTATDSTKWFALYGSYANEAAALADLKNAKTLSQKLGVSYQGLTDLVETGFLNPALYALIYQFQRFGIDMGTAFSFTNQPGYAALSAQQTTDFQATLDAITARYKTINPGSTFDAKAWLVKTLPANYSKTVLVLADPDTGCNFSGTTLQYADGSPAAPIDFLRLNLLVRLCGKLGCSLNEDAPAAVPQVDPPVNAWSLDEIDCALQAFFPVKNLPLWTDPGFSKAFGDSWKTSLVYAAHLDDLNTRLAPALGRIALLPLWATVPTQGQAPLYAQIFLLAGELNNDFAFDDPNGAFPAPASDLPAAQQILDAHASVVQGALGLATSDLTAILADAGVALPAAFSLANLSLCYRYSQISQCLQISVSDLIALKTMSGLNPFQPLTGNPLVALADDIFLTQTLAFVKQVAVAQASGFTVEDLQYLLRQQFDPIGKYQTDANARVTLVQSLAGGIKQIQAQNTSSDPASMPESLIDQSLSGVIPASILKGLFTLLTGSQTYSTSANSAAPLSAGDFTTATELTLSYDFITTTQTLTIQGLLLDWRKAEIKALNTNPALNAVLATLLGGLQQAARNALISRIGDLLGLWASLTEYEAVATAVTPALAISDPLGKLQQADPSLTCIYDSSDQLQRVAYRGVLTADKRLALTTIDPSPTLAGLLAIIQQQALPAYNEMTGSLLAMCCNAVTYKTVQGGLPPGSQVDPATFAAALAAAQQSGAITGPLPFMQLSYDLVAQVQTLTCTGVLTDSMRTQLAGLLTAPPAVAALLGSLLQSVRSQAIAEFQYLATGLLAPALNDPDAFVTPFLGAAGAQQQKFAKAELVKVFLPLLAQKQSRYLVLRTLTAALGADASLLEALVTNAALLNDPNSPGKSLLQTFLAAGQSGVTASYYNKNGALLSQATVPTADTGGIPPGTVSCHFEGYLQVASDGPYRFYTQLGNNGVEATFHLDSADPTVLFSNPVIDATAAKDGDSASQFVTLRGGVGYHFTLDCKRLGPAAAKLLIQGETLPLGPLSQAVLLPQQALDAFGRAETLLSKVLQILSVTAIGLREVSYMVANASQFNQLRLSSLPTQQSDDSPAKAAVLFAQFLTLADYSDLRKGPAGATDGLIDVFQSAATSPGVAAAYYATPDETGSPQAVAMAATADTADPSNSKPGTMSCRFEGYLVVPADGSYDFFADLGKAGAQVAFRLDAPRGIASLANPIVLQHTAAADGEEVHQPVMLKSGVAYHLKVDFLSLGGGGASLLVQGGTLARGPLNRLVLYPISQLPPWVLLANVTRRNPQVVADVATALGPDAHFSNNVGIRRMWDALQLVQVLSLPVQAVSASTGIISPAPAAPDVIAANFKNAVKAQGSANQWRPIAQSVFDPLRRLKRNALVSYLVNALQLENSNQLFEYFLVDPGMEPIVQTSRLRLALSSVQTFVQRCFLNLENGNTAPALDVSASSIPADWWSWMKRYRVWEANREIFLFPENWMEPELRLDKTDLFQALEGALLQGDVTRDLVEDAFSDYLKGLDLRARMDIVASYLDQDLTNPGESTLYVLGRTYTIARKYFFRTYANAVWGGWQAVPVHIEGDHMVLVVWHGRLNLFWATFVTGADASGSSSSQTGEVGQLPFDTLVSSITGSDAQKQIQVQLHWSEYVQGKWTNRISTDPNKFQPIEVEDDFTPNRDVYIHVSKEVDSDGNEGAVKVLLSVGGYDGYGFRVTSKNCDPAFGWQYFEWAPEIVYNTWDVDATCYAGSKTLQAGFESAITTTDSTYETENILNTVNNFELLACANPVVPPFLTPSNRWDYVEAGALVSPFFFKDTTNPNFASQRLFQDERTYFVQPSLTETVIVEWYGWAVVSYQPNHYAMDPNLLKQLNVVAQVPLLSGPVNPGDPAYSIFQIQSLDDWVTTPGVAVAYGDVSVGKSGGIATTQNRNVAAAVAAPSHSQPITVIGKQGAAATQLQRSLTTTSLATGVLALAKS